MPQQQNAVDNKNSTTILIAVLTRKLWNCFNVPFRLSIYKAQ